MMNWLTKHLIDDWRGFWKRWSVVFAFIVGLLTTLSTATQQNAGLLMSLIGYLPANGTLRIVCSILLGLMVTALPTLLVLLKQKNL